MPAIKLKKVTAEYLAEKEKAAEKEKEKSKKSLEDVAEGQEEEDEVKPYNFLDVEVLWDKRKRTLPASEQKLVEWLDANLESKTDVYLPLLTLYEYYSEVCQMQGSQVVDVPVFNRYIKDKFGKFFGFQENSPYRVLIKEKKYKEKKPKVEGEGGQLKMRDIIREVIETAGNPRKGLRFSVVNKFIIQKYPAHKIGMTPKKLKAALERGVYYGHIKLVRGVGMCGYYRLPGEPTIEEEDPKKPKTEAKTEDGEKESLENGVDEGEAGESTEQGGTKRKAEGEESAEASPKKKQKKKSTKKKKKPVEKMYRSEASKHSDPQKVEDAFPMAITYQSDPKECSTAKIRNYISKYYHVEVNQEKLKKALEAGVEKGLWEVTKGNGIHGTYHLLIESFNPARSDNLMDQIAQALVACHEPKCASVGLIKKYITQYHPKLNIESRPHLFKSALERATNKGIIRQLTGVGASGSFQLVYQFFPSPAILAGDTTDEEVEDEVVDGSDDDGPVEYIPRPTKRGRIAQRKQQTSLASSKPRGRSAPTDPKKSKAKGGKPATKSAKKGTKVIYVDDEDDDDADDEVEIEEYTPRKSMSRGGGGSAKASQSGKKTSTKVATPAKKGKTPVTENKSAKKSTPKPVAKGKSEAQAKSTPASAKKGSPKKSTPKKIVINDSEDEPISDQEEYVPKPSKRRGGASEPAAKSETKKSSKSRRR